MKILAIVLGIVLLLGVIAGVYVYTKDAPEAVMAEPTSFAECAARYPVMESYPRQCNTPTGLHFVEEVTAPPAPVMAKIDDLIEVERPVVNQQIATPFTITGQARGFWYFEATFPIELRNASGTVIASHYAEAEDEWMTEEFVPFTATLTFPQQPAGTTGTLVLKKSNASGDPVRDQELVIPVTF